ncbi:DeoR family transcriptional regulator [Herbiconiux sp. A18JL235]|uniref:Lactose phosphotransferase system repressor n=1 Tax=Herbiconiux sp. A18JL235 TaxID=3152363 RepID=A0AB39BD49_9MICO
MSGLGRASGLGSTVRRRRESILSELAQHGRVEVAQLARSLDVAEETVRRDLSALEAAGALLRAHGGAVPADLGADPETNLRLGPVDFVTADAAGVAVAIRSAAASAGAGASGSPAETAEAHRRVGEVAAAVVELLPDAGALYLDGGPVSEAIASRLREERRLTILTASVPVALAAAESSDPGEVHLLGGRVGVDGATEGPWARSGAEGLRLAMAVFDGGQGLPGSAVLATDPEAAALAEALATSAERVVLVYPGVHRSAHGSSSAWLTSLPLSAVDTVVAHPFALAGAADGEPVSDEMPRHDGRPAHDEVSDRSRQLAGELRERGIDLVMAGRAA